ncbi:leucine-rich repeat-containing protein 58-like [Branchiostoma floridae]|uniref:Leucine-rich repeat protein SHOC-2 n=1 Tax=Branchiostoma floridae TaxID=7739 RepID=A0A9J7LB25_BRAFL|nr:leucine-rich repeat-containing protein 58-like [Branchiostoma floridae]XP_035678848.1 leucine-rich repeat-containing protein 58-like [Branchiostoma floridae]
MGAAARDVLAALLEGVFASGDVQTTTLAFSIACSLGFSVACLLIGLVYGRQSPRRQRPVRTSSFSSGVSGVPSVVSKRIVLCKKSSSAEGRHLLQHQPVFLTCREQRREHRKCSRCDSADATQSCRYRRCLLCCRASKQSICDVHGTAVMAVQNIVEGACEDRPTDLDLSYLGLHSCPDRIGFVGAQLTCLNLSNNRLHQLPDDIGCLRGLEELYIQYNCLEELPVSIGNLTKLTDLDCKNNSLRTIPLTVGNLSALTCLNVTNNVLQRLPAELGRLTELEEICAHSNQLVELPDELCNLTNLTELYLGENRLQQLPQDMGRLVRLEELDVSSCELTHLPDSLSRCTSLVRLWLSNNRLRYLPDQLGRLHHLKELHVRNNDIMYFPASLSYLQLYTFSANQNPLIEEWDNRLTSALIRVPTDPLPSLLELAARTVARQNITWGKGDLPLDLEVLLQCRKQCSSCEGPFFSYFSSQVFFSNVGMFHRVPLYQQVCSPYVNAHCQPVHAR